MHRPNSNPGPGINSALGRYSAKKMAKPVNFICDAPGAHSVTLIGDFNDWDPTAYPMKRQPDGAWLVQIQLNHGHHHYQFLVDGKPTLDPRAQGVARNEKNEKVSLLAVS
jgi:1,4-alpha-glucan branching enzyme